MTLHRDFQTLGERKLSASDLFICICKAFVIAKLEKKLYFALVFTTLHKEKSFPLSTSSVSATTDLVTFTEEIHSEKRHFLCSAISTTTHFVNIFNCFNSFHYSIVKNIEKMAQNE